MADPVARIDAPARPLRFAWPVSLVLGAAIVALSAQVAIPVPLSPVPMTLQGLAVLLVGGLFGAAAGAGALVLYLVLGIVGLPVFSPLGAPGIARILGPTGGYLLAFPVAAAVVGRIAQRDSLVRCFLGAFAAMIVIHLGGWAQLTLLTGGPSAAATTAVLPLVAQDLLKVVIATLVLWKTHQTLRPRI
ncbi:MAG TPA: biotin transporter BioY [Gemmatimonadales bacterium]|nr:biotin transporter BioY [Gemmatimonadales bacterium]